MESPGTENRPELGVEDLEGDVACIPEVASKVDGRHSAHADWALEGVAPFQSGGEAGIHGWRQSYSMR